jgi:hypothetical protein
VLWRSLTSTLIEKKRNRKRDIIRRSTDGPIPRIYLSRRDAKSSNGNSNSNSNGNSGNGSKNGPPGIAGNAQAVDSSQGKVYLTFNIIVASSFLTIIRNRDTFSSCPVSIKALSVVFPTFRLILVKIVDRFSAVLSVSAKSFT